jgi:hypothetical protein
MSAYYVFNVTGPKAEYTLLGDRRYKGPVIDLGQAHGDTWDAGADRQRKHRRKKTEGYHDQRCRNGRTAQEEA